MHRATTAGDLQTDGLGLNGGQWLQQQGINSLVDMTLGHSKTCWRKASVAYRGAVVKGIRAEWGT